MTDKEYWQAKYEAAKARDRDNADIFTENPYKRARMRTNSKPILTALTRLLNDLMNFSGKA